MKNVAEIARAIMNHQAASTEPMMYAVRSDNAAKPVGSICRRSLNLADWRDDCKKLPGTSGTQIGDTFTDYTDAEEVEAAVAEAIAYNAKMNYGGKHVYIIAGTERWAESGDDNNEVVLSTDSRDCFGRDYKGAQVVAKIA